MLARAIVPVVGYDKAAVCVLDGESTIVVMVDNCDDEPQTAIKQLQGGPGRLVQWLTALFDRSSWQPGGIVVVGPDEDLAALSPRLKKTVPVPVITQTGAELALARGAALASAQSTEFTDTEMVETINSWRGDRGTSRQHSYAGALTMLVAGAVTFVASLSLAVGPHLVPNRAPGPVQHGGPPGSACSRRPGTGPAAGSDRGTGCATGTAACTGGRAGPSSSACSAANRRRSGTVGRTSRRRTGSAARAATAGGPCAATGP